MAVSSAPLIVTRHLGDPDSFTLKRYLANGGYGALRKALEIGREAVPLTSAAASPSSSATWDIPSSVR